MHKLSPSTSFFIQLAKSQAILSYRFDRALGGLGFTEFLILLQLDQAPGGQLSRIALAENIGLTASGITRVLLPMAKVHLVKDGKASDDARVRSVEATAAGKQKLADEIARLKFLTDDLVLKNTHKELERIADVLRDIAGRAKT